MTAEKNTWPGWECVKKLGAGAYGSVYEIRRVENGVEYKAALKVISIPKNSDEMADATIAIGLDLQSTPKYYQSIVDNIKREVELLSTLKGRTNIVSYEDHMVIPHEDGVGADIYIRMELLTPLYQYMRIRQWSTMPEQEVVRLGCDICKALEICEKKQIIHRDIKPENIFVNEDGDFVLGDFGVARTLEKSVAASTRIGTESYMAPEVFKGLKYDCRADIYSLGLVLYRLLNKNREPFMPLPPQVPQATDLGYAFERRLKGEPIPSPVDCTPELQKVILKAVAYRPEDRYGNADEFQMALRSCMFGTEPSSHPAPKPEPKQAKKKKVIIEVVVAVLVACLVIAVVGVGIYQGKIGTSKSTDGTQVEEDGTTENTEQNQETEDDSTESETAEIELVYPRVIAVGDSVILHIREEGADEYLPSSNATWTVENPDIFSVTVGGKVTAKAVGSTTLTVEYQGQRKTKQIWAADDSAAQDIEFVSDSNEDGNYVANFSVSETLSNNIEWYAYISNGDEDEGIALSGDEIYQKELTLYQPSAGSRDLTVVVVDPSERTKILAKHDLFLRTSNDE